MATIHNSKIIQNIINKAKIQTSVDDVPTRLAEKVVPVMEVKPDVQIRMKNRTLSDSASGTVWTTSTTKDTYVIGAVLSYSKDAISTSIYTILDVVPFGSTSENILVLRYEPLTAGSGYVNITIPIPLKLLRGSNVTLYNDTGVASIDVATTVFYYEMED